MRISICDDDSVILGEVDSLVRRYLMSISQHERWDDLFAIHNGFMVLSYLFISVLVIFFSRRIYKKFPQEKRIPNKRETLFLLVPSLNCLFIGSILSLIVAYVIQNNSDLYSTVPAIPWLIAITNVVMLAGIFITLDLFQYEVLYQNERHARSIIQNRSLNMQERIEELEGLYSGIRGMKHDMKNHLSHLAGLMNRAGVQDAEVTEYLTTMETTLKAFDYEYATGHPITDVIINGYNQKMKKQGISFEVEFQYPTNLSIDAFDIGIVLSNALDNALTAVKDVPGSYVKLRGEVKNSVFFLVEVVNNFIGQVNIDTTIGLPYSTKAEEGHGIGLQNIRGCARKYMGDIDIRVNGGVFVLAVMMKDNRE